MTEVNFFSALEIFEKTPLIAPPVRHFDNSVTPAAMRNATMAVLNTSDSKTAKNDLQIFVGLVDRYPYSTGVNRGLSIDTARLDVVIGANADSTVDRKAVFAPLPLIALRRREFSASGPR